MPQPSTISPHSFANTSATADVGLSSSIVPLLSDVDAAGVLLDRHRDLAAPSLVTPPSHKN
jgi:hypothetical protein